jgi:pimeloyl-[acyl-carrier protein] synthase
VAARRRPRFNPLQPDVLADPYPSYARMRAEAPVLFDRRFGWLIFRYDDVAAALKDPRLSARRPAPDDPIPRTLLPIADSVKDVRERQGRWLLCADPPRHTHLRGLVSSPFSPRAVEAMRDVIQQTVDELLDEVQDRVAFDVIRDLAYPLPATVIGRLLGVPSSDLDALKTWSDAIAGSFTWAPDTMLAAHAAFVELTDYMERLIARGNSHAGVLTAALVDAHDAGTLSREDMLAQCVMLLFAGHETTTNLIGNGLLALLRHPAELERLRSAPSLIESAVEELLRFDSPTQATFRSVAEGFELRGQQLRQGDHVLLMLGSANRDQEQFADPDTLDLARRDNRHLAFSQGPHFCLGAALARLEGETALHSLIQRSSSLELVDLRQEWRPNVFLRGLSTLWIGANFTQKERQCV